MHELSSASRMRVRPEHDHDSPLPSTEDFELAAAFTDFIKELLTTSMLRVSLPGCAKTSAGRFLSVEETSDEHHDHHHVAERDEARA